MAKLVPRPFGLSAAGDAATGGEPTAKAQVTVTRYIGRDVSAINYQLSATVCLYIYVGWCAGVQVCRYQPTRYNKVWLDLIIVGIERLMLIG